MPASKLEAKTTVDLDSLLPPTHVTCNTAVLVVDVAWESGHQHGGCGKRRPTRTVVAACLFSFLSYTVKKAGGGGNTIISNTNLRKKSSGKVPNTKVLL